MSEAQLPTKEEIEKLPCWARVAFAARCARRAQPLFQKQWPDAPAEHVTAIETAIGAAENATADADAAAKAAYAAARAAYAYVDTASAADVDTAYAYADTAYAYADTAYAYAAARAAHAAARAAYAYVDTASASAADAYADTASAAAYAAQAGVPVISIARDFQTILEKSRREKWTDETPVPPSVFGLLDEVDIASKPAEPLRLYFEKGVFSPTEIAEMIGHLSELYHSIGGDKLIIDDIGTLYPEQTPITSDVPEDEEVLV